MHLIGVNACFDRSLLFSMGIYYSLKPVGYLPSQPGLLTEDHIADGQTVERRPVRVEILETYKV